MAIKRIEKERKETYQQLSQPIKSEIDNIRKKIQNVEVSSMRESGWGDYKYFIVANLYTEIAINYIKMNRISVHVMDLKQDELLENARKSLYNAIANLEKLAGDVLDGDLNEISERLNNIPRMTPYRRLYLVKKIELTLKVLSEELEGGKWKYKLLEMFSKLAVVAKNLINFREFTSMSPMNPNYRYYNELISYAKDLMKKSADDYREKYEISGHEVADMRKAQEFLKAIMRINNVLGYYEESKEIKKIIDKWSQKMEEDLKVKENRK
ncbi:MAG: hypothetical protein RMJ37_01290 [Spirochaetia bacterium]|nr:hypothetical protein [Spirochaetota bacterium]MDW8111957.1 hypothetical protein [Spirochaetia bacterium]